MSVIFTWTYLNRREICKNRQVCSLFVHFCRFFYISRQLNPFLPGISAIFQFEKMLHLSLSLCEKSRFSKNSQILLTKLFACFFCCGAAVPEYEVVSPFQADETGKFVTHILQKSSRTKRTTSKQSSWFYKINAFGLPLHLNVTKDRHIVAPGTVVETTHENGSTTYSAPPKNTFYSGHVVSHPASSVAISNQDGLVCTDI